MAELLTAYIFTAAVFFAIDLVWLSRVAKKFYNAQIGEMLRAKPLAGAAAGFYALYVVGIVYFAIAPALAAQSIDAALVRGAAFGFFAYATYDMTNYATLRNWPVAVTVVDIAWGTVLTGVAAVAGYVLTTMIL